jgi:hypothetical protein
VCTACLQLFATSSLLRMLGMPAALGLAPAICVAALLAIACAPQPGVVAASEVARKVGRGAGRGSLQAGWRCSMRGLARLEHAWC